MSSSALYSKITRDQRLEELEELQTLISRRRQITLNEDETLDTISESADVPQLFSAQALLLPHLSHILRSCLYTPPHCYHSSMTPCRSVCPTATHDICAVYHTAWWPSYKYEEKFAEIRQRYERHLLLSHCDVPPVDFVGDSGQL